LLATWFTSGGRLELRGEELAHDFRDFPTGRIVLRQRESDDIVAKLSLYDGRRLTIAERKARLELRDKLAIREDHEKRLSHGLRLMFADPTLSCWMFSIYRDSGDAARAVTSFVHHELDDNPFIDPDTIKMRVISPKDSEIYQPWYITQADVAAITTLREKRDKKFGRGGHTKTVTELPDEVRGAEAIPAVMTEMAATV
jgi:hypothetical protein